MPAASKLTICSAPPRRKIASEMKNLDGARLTSNLANPQITSQSEREPIKVIVRAARERCRQGKPDRPILCAVRLARPLRREIIARIDLPEITSD